MTLEYLLSDLNDKEIIESLAPEGCSVSVHTTVRGKCTYIRITHDGNGEATAKKLSGLNDQIVSRCKVLTLTNECAKYFTGRLYPLVSDFECKLRKLLYLASADNPDNPVNKNIKGLEAKDFGELFEILFVDIDFFNAVKAGIKNRDKKEFTKADVLSYIDSFEENTNWDKLLSKSAAPTFRRRFMDVKRYRNDVMHMHYISLGQYTEAKQLFNAVNKELDTMLEGILGKAETPEIDENFNDTLAQALSEHQWSAEQFEQFAKAVEPSLQAMDRLRSIAFDEEKYKKIVELSNLYSPVLQQEYEKWQEISQKALSPEVAEQLERLAKMEQALTANYDKIANALQTLQPFLKNPDDASTVGPDNNSESTQKPEQSKEEQVEESDESNPS